jgi:subtilase family serine protease
LEPNQLAAAYDIPSRWQAGYPGHQPTVALLEVGQALDQTRWDQFSACYGPFAEPDQDVVSGAGPAPGGEGLFDPEAVASAASSAKIYMFESGTGGGSVAQHVPEVLPTLLRAALNPANTGGKLVDAISTSEVTCEASWTAPQVRAMQAALRLAASLDVPVLAASGDGGSVGTYVSAGAPTCVFWPVDENTTQPDWPGLKQGVQYPASSPEVTSVGGTELEINGVVPQPGSSDYYGAPAGGTITNELVWNEAYPSWMCDWDGTTTVPPNPECYFAGGGGQSGLFTVADAPWQSDIGLTGHERKPDISALAGSPAYFGGAIGTSGAAPLMAGAIAVLDGYLAAQNAPAIGPLNPTLYRIETKPKIAAGVFNDVTVGTNALLGESCCAARSGYDEASGLGSLNIRRLGAALLNHPGLRVPWTRLRLVGAPASSIGVPEDMEASTNNSIRGTPYYVNIFVNGKFLVACKTSVCARSVSPGPPYPKTLDATADVGPSHAKPFGPLAIASAKTVVTVAFRHVSCHGSTCA